MAEAIGIALAVAPLAVSAIEYYSTTVRVITRYKLYKSKREELVSKLEVQHAIFRKTVSRMLAYDVGLGDDVASQMLADAHHPSWTDDETKAYFDLRLGDVSEPMLSLLHMMHSQLAVLRVDEFTASHSTSLGSNSDSDGGERAPNIADIQSRGSVTSKFNTELKGDSLPTASVGKKLRFAVSEKRVREALETLRNLTTDFRTLIEQTAPPQGRIVTSSPSKPTRDRVTGYAAVKTAATDLYHALGLACTKHTSHHARLSLKPTYGTSSQIRFTIAFRHSILANEGSKVCSDTRYPMWLTVESQIRGTIQTTKGSKLLDEVVRTTMKRPAESTAVSDSAAKPKKLIKKAVKFKLDIEKVSEMPLSVIRRDTPELVAPVISNLCTQSNFCNQLQNHLAQPLSKPHFCIGYLDCSGKSKHLVYINSKEQTISPIPLGLKLRPLCEVYTFVKQENTSGPVIPLHQSITLAKELAMAVLQFHATPWLLNSICSNDVLLPETSGSTFTSAKTLHEPYVDVSIRGPHDIPTRQTTFPSRTLIRNRLLFSLGVMMLELAYQAPLYSLQRSTDVDAHVAPNTDYHTADRLRHAVAARVHPKYAEVVRKCIQCDFGHGDDLGQTKLQEGFHQDVICELEDLEDRLRRFSIGS